MLKSIEKERVKLLPSIFKERYELNRNYLLSLKNEGLLQNFYLEAGIKLPGYQVLHNPDTEDIFWGWEAPTCQLRGHFLGHWLSAAASIIASDQDYEMKAKLDKIIDELSYCQELNGGEWVGSIPEKYFKKLELSQDIWSPQYVMHKTLMGLTHAYTLAGNEKALNIIDQLSNWYLDWMRELQKKNSYAVYKGEEAGMLEIWATLYQVTGQNKYLELANGYSKPGIFNDLLEGRDALTNCHANACIPWAHGAAKLYEVTGDEKWRNIVEAFWKSAVTDRGAFCTGGQNAGEYWIPPFKLGHFLNERNQEFCTVYNMIRLASYLYQWTGDTTYTDYIELNLYNGVLAQQNMWTGMPTYFLPLKAGSRKKWGTKTRDFWCCYGTMVQAQTMYNSITYYEENDRLVVSQYIPSEIKWSYNHSHILIKQTTDMKYYNDTALFDEKDDSQMSRWLLKFKVSAERKEQFTISFRLPQWVKEAPVVTMNHEAMDDIEIKAGYINITREWLEDEIILYLPAGLETSSLTDIPDNCAFMEGPIVLAGICDGERALEVKEEQPEELLMPQYEHTYQMFPWKQSTYKTVHQAQNIEFIPLYEVTDETYTVYFPIRR